MRDIIGLEMKGRRRELQDGTSGFRLWKDQLTALKLLQEQDSELDNSEAVRRGLDMFIEKKNREFGNDEK